MNPFCRWYNWYRLQPNSCIRIATQETGTMIVGCRYTFEQYKTPTWRYTLHQSVSTKALICRYTCSTHIVHNIKLKHNIYFKNRTFFQGIFFYESCRVVPMTCFYWLELDTGFALFNLWTVICSSWLNHAICHIIR